MRNVAWDPAGLPSISSSSPLRVLTPMLKARPLWRRAARFASISLTESGSSQDLKSARASSVVGNVGGAVHVTRHAMRLLHPAAPDQQNLRFAVKRCLNFVELILPVRLRGAGPAADCRRDLLRLMKGQCKSGGHGAKRCDFDNATGGWQRQDSNGETGQCDHAAIAGRLTAMGSPHPCPVEIPCFACPDATLRLPRLPARITHATIERRGRKRKRVPQLFAAAPDVECSRLNQ